MVMSVVFTAVCILLTLLSMFVVSRFLKLKYSQKTVRLESTLKSIILILLLFFSAVFGCACFALEKVSYDSTPEFDGVYVIESDMPVNPENINDYDKNYLYVHDENHTFYSEDEDSESAVVTALYEFWDDGDADVSYKIHRAYAEFMPTKKYIMVVPEYAVWDENDNYEQKVDFDKCEWLNTSQDHMITVGNYEYYGAFFNVTIKTHKCN